MVSQQATKTESTLEGPDLTLSKRWRLWTFTRTARPHVEGSSSAVLRMVLGNLNEIERFCRPHAY